MDDSDRQRLRWRCRRGMLELDLVLQEYLARCFPAAGAGERAAFIRLLEQPDHNLLQWIHGTMEGVSPDLAEIVGKLQRLTVRSH